MNHQRDKAWRKFQDEVHPHKGKSFKDKPEKNWKLMYFRSRKLHRAKQLGFTYPIENMLKLLTKELDRE